MEFDSILDDLLFNLAKPLSKQMRSGDSLGYRKVTLVTGVPSLDRCSLTWRLRFYSAMFGVRIRVLRIGCYGIFR
jgi:hypothetical protein